MVKKSNNIKKGGKKKKQQKKSHHVLLYIPTYLHTDLLSGVYLAKEGDHEVIIIHGVLLS